MNALSLEIILLIRNQQLELLCNEHEKNTGFEVRCLKAPYCGSVVQLFLVRSNTLHIQIKAGRVFGHGFRVFSLWLAGSNDW